MYVATLSLAISWKGNCGNAAKEIKEMHVTGFFKWRNDGGRAVTMMTGSDLLLPKLLELPNFISSRWWSYVEKKNTIVIIAQKPPELSSDAINNFGPETLLKSFRYLGSLFGYFYNPATYIHFHSRHWVRSRSQLFRINLLRYVPVLT